MRPLCDREAAWYRRRARRQLVLQYSVIVGISIAIGAAIACVGAR